MNDTKGRGSKRSPPETQPRKPNTTIMGAMLEIMKLVNKNKQLKEGRYD